MRRYAQCTSRSSQKISATREVARHWSVHLSGPGILTLDIGTGAASVAFAGGSPSPRAQLARGQPRSEQPPGAQLPPPAVDAASGSRQLLRQKCRLQGDGAQL
ncbi:hypothetical protein HaLaN_33104 [Haematococcus lacustris]|uniref:Uncharacterized protein n=1 Tax=Haematococcus lacustris TaxID=44745 RepID=A0A6A0ALH0_HAELA|nr:hypothetical protein HaLaN_33104 [Haematococcus lacustris]